MNEPTHNRENEAVNLSESESSDIAIIENNETQAEEMPELELPENLLQIVEAAIFAAGEPLSIDRLLQLFPNGERPPKAALREVLQQIAEFYVDRGVELIEVGSGYRFQARADYASSLQRLWEKKPPRYSRALLETLALIVYRQPITRGEIEDVRGVAVSTHITKTLLEHGWVKIIGHKDVPGKPALWGTTKQFLDYFNLKTLSQLPPLEDLVDLDELEKKLGMQLNFEVVEEEVEDALKGEVQTDEETPAITEEEAEDNFEIEMQTDEETLAIVVEEAEDNVESLNDSNEALLVDA